MSPILDLRMLKKLVTTGDQPGRFWWAWEAFLHTACPAWGVGCICCVFPHKSGVLPATRSCSVAEVMAEVTALGPPGWS